MWGFRFLNTWMLFVMILITTASSSYLPSSSSLSFTFDRFSMSSTKDLIFSGNASLSETSVVLTTNPYNPSDAIITGRVTSSEILHLWDKATGSLADFDTNFTFVVNSPDSAYGCCGLAFFLAPEVFPLTHSAFGSGLGLVGDLDQFLQSKYPFLAVEFDTFPDTLFPDGPFDHVGIDISSIKSVNFTQSMNKIVDGNVTNVWITYNSSSKNLGVTFSRFKDNALLSQQVSHVIDLRDFLPEYVQVGFSASTGTTYTTQSLNSWSFSSRFKVGDDPNDLATWPALAPAIPGSDDVDSSIATFQNMLIHMQNFISRFEVSDDHYQLATPPTSAPGIPGSGSGGDGDGDGNKPTGKNKQLQLKIGLSVGLACFFICGIIIYGWLKFPTFNMKLRNTVEKIDEDPVEKMDEDPATLLLTVEFEKTAGPNKFCYDVLARATKNFAEEEKLGEGGFGEVYRGFLPELNLHVAVKKISSKSKQGIKGYASEVKIVSRVRHKNLVELIGWCHERGELLLVYELMENGSLDHHLFRSENVLSWPLRYKIARGLASALLYLHEDADGEQAVLHRDIKSANVMLDSGFNAKVGDFGLAKLVDHGKGSATTIFAGTFGYMAPECLNTSTTSTESDVYSFGVVCLEIACGRKPIDPTAEDGRIRLVNWVWDLYGRGEIIQALDPRLAIATSSDSYYEREQVERVMILGLWCAHPDYMLRPSMRQAISVLNFQSPLPNLPSKIPVATYINLSTLKRASDDSDATASSSAYISNSSGFPRSLSSSETYSSSTSVLLLQAR